jgi:hypothetical protein
MEIKMRVELKERTSVNKREVLGTFDNFELAIIKLEEMEPEFWEVDIEHDSCADAYMKDGRILTIEPVGFYIKNS